MSKSLDLSATILAEMVKLDWRLFRFALLFRHYSGSQIHKDCIAYYSTVTHEKICYYTGKILDLTKYFRCSQLHRDQFSNGGRGPALTLTDSKGKRWESKWYFMGKLHRPFREGPASKKIHLAHRFKSRKWYEFGESPTNPSQIKSIFRDWNLSLYFYRDRYVNFGSGGVQIHEKNSGRTIIFCAEYYFEKWIVDEKLHRVDGPAVVMTGRGTWVGDANIISAQESGYQNFWYDRGVLHRLDGPAIESNREYGDQWFHNGEPIAVFRPRYTPIILQSLLGAD